MMTLVLDKVQWQFCADWESVNNLEGISPLCFRERECSLQYIFRIWWRTLFACLLSIFEGFSRLEHVVMSTSSFGVLSILQDEPTSFLYFKCLCYE